MSKVAFMFPGQGAQYVGMGKDFYDTYEEAKAVFQLAGEVTGLDMESLCFTENDKLNVTEYTQIAMLATEVAILKVVEAKGIKADVCAGLSLGEYGALAAAKVMEGKKVAKGVRCIIIPGTQQIWLDAMHEGLFDIFVNAGAIVSTPTCGPCLGGHMGVLAQGEKAVSTTNRNFVGRMGHIDSEIYLASPAVAAASAVAGYIADPAKICE